MIRRLFKLIIILIISIIIGNTIYGIYKESKISNKPNNISSYNSMKTDNYSNVEKEDKNKLDEEIPKEYNGYKVSSKISIPKINLESYILDDKSDEAMWMCPVIYYGPEPNEEGNYCIAAHNYDKENMFNHIIKLETGDKIYLSDNKHGKIEYEVYDIYKTKPSDTKPLIQNTDGALEITLITCSDYSSKRIIVKAREV